MIDRRTFAFAAAASLLVPAHAQGGRRTMKLGNPAGINDAQQCFMTCGRHPKLRYYEQEGIDLEFVNMTNASQSMQTVITGETNFATVVPVLYFLQTAKEPNLGIVAAYNWMPRNASVVCVNPQSPIRSVAELKGKRIGIRNQGDAGTVAMKAMLKELGVDDSGLVFIPVGDGGPAGTALKENRVDALVSFDTAAARVELAGFPLRYLELPPQFAKLSGAWYGVSAKDLKADRKAYVGLFRAVAKSTLFARTNLDRAIDIHWQLYPESKPKTKSDDEGRNDFKTILARRKDNWMRHDNDADKRIGAIDPADVRAQVALAGDAAHDPGIAAKIGDPARLFTNELIDEVNAFDKQAVIRQAQTFSFA